MVTATQFIRAAAMKSGQVTTAMGKTISYTDVDVEIVDDEICFLCGGYTNQEGTSTKKGIKDTFTDGGYVKYPASKTLCKGCSFSLSYLPLRNYSIIATQHGIEHPDKARLQQALIYPPSPPFLIVVAVSGQKWLHFKSEVSYSQSKYLVMLEETQVVVEPKKLDVVSRLIESLMMEFSKTEILSGNYSQLRIKKYGMGKWNRIEKVIAKHRGSGLFELAVHLAQKKEEEPCITDLIPTISTPPQQHSSSMPPGAAGIKRSSKSIPMSGEESSDLPKPAQNEQLTWDLF